MLAFSPPLFSSMGLLLEEELLSHSQNLSFYKHSLSSSSNSKHEFSSKQQPPPPSSLMDPTMVKKLQHNASERDRRKKINTLVSSLRSLLPIPRQTKKMSIPVTITRVLKYIPELQQQVEELTKKKKELLSGISRQENAEKSERKITSPHNSVFVVSTSRLNESEATIQISSYDDVINKTPLSDILLYLEKTGPLLLNASSSQTFGGRVFYNLHLQVEKTQRLDSEIIAEKLLSLARRS